MAIGLIADENAAAREFGSGMFDLTSSKLLILGLVALIVVGPKDLPLLLRTVGKYLGMIRRQANEFRAQFDEAMREQDLANLKSEMEAVGRDVQNTVHTASRAVETELTAATQDIDQNLKANAEPSAAAGPEAPQPATVDTAFDALPVGASVAPYDGPAADGGHHALNGATPHPPSTQVHAADPALKVGA